MKDNVGTFTYELGAQVTLAMSQEHGEIVGRAEYTNAADAYYVRYVAADGRQVEAWLSEDALS
jgi:hypothetical protein